MKKNIAKKSKVKNAANGYKLAPIIPEGTILTDNLSNKWQLAQPIGSGGFGCLYIAKSLANLNNENVLKLEPAENGPLFCEINFYIRSAKPDMIKDWIIKNKINYLGVPNFVGSGQLDYFGSKYRFLVMPKFGSDLQKIFESCGKLFEPHTVFLLGLKMIDALQYIHEKGFAHADIKAANLMTGFKDPHNVYLIDYGLAYRYMGDSQKLEAYKLDPKWANNGTVEFTSRDAHDGAKPAPRGDLEILGYCMWQWLTGSLPWEIKLTDLKFVSDLKKRYMADIKNQIGPLIKNTVASNEFCNYMSEIAKLNYTDIPKYNIYRNIFERAIKSLGHKLSDKLSFDKLVPKTPQGNRSREASRKMNGTPLSPSNGVSPTKKSKNELRKVSNKPKRIENYPITPQTDRSLESSRKMNETPLSPSNEISPPNKSKNEPRKVSNKPKKIENTPIMNNESPKSSKKKKVPTATLR